MKYGRYIRKSWRCRMTNGRIIGDFLKDWIGERSSSEELHRFFWVIGQLYLAGNRYEYISARDIS